MVYRSQLHPWQYYASNTYLCVSVRTRNDTCKCIPVASESASLCVRMFKYTCSSMLACALVCARSKTHLRGVDASLLEGAVAGVLRAHVAIFAPVAGEVSSHTGQAPGAGEKRLKFFSNYFFIPENKSKTDKSVSAYCRRSCVCI